MRPLSRIALLVSLGLQAVPASASVTGPVVNPANANHYYVFDDLLHWAAAENLALSLGGHLVTINDAAENAWVVSTLTVAGGTYWIGARDDALEGSFVWESGQLWSYTNWSAGEPDDDVALGGGGDFAYLSGGTGGWGDTNGSFVGFITGGIVEVPDTDADDDVDVADNCTLVANPSQLDADGDGYGNLCDADLNNSDLVTAADFGLLRSCLNQSSGASALCAAADMNGSGLVTTADFGLLRPRLNTAPGPSGLNP
jgi:hypothetical protein